MFFVYLDACFTRMNAKPIITAKISNIMTIIVINPFVFLVDIAISIIVR